MWPLILLGAAIWAKSRADAARMSAGPSSPMQGILDARVSIVKVPQVPWGKVTMGPTVGRTTAAIPFVAANRTVPSSAMRDDTTTAHPTLGAIPPLSCLTEFEVMVAKPDPAAAIEVQINPSPEHLAYGRTDY